MTSVPLHPLQHLLLGDGAGGEAEDEAEAADDQSGVEAAEDRERAEVAEAEAEVEAVDILTLLV